MSPDWDSPRQVWHDHYPSDIPPTMSFDALRAERLLLAAANRFPKQTVIQFSRTKWTYEQLVDLVKTVAGNLRQLGIGPGDRVMLVLPNCPEYVVTWFALHWLGAEVVQANPLLAAKDLARMLKDSGAKMVLGLDVRIAPVLASLRECPDRMLVVTSLAPHLPVHLSLPYRLKTLVSRPRVANADLQIIPFRKLLASGERVNEPVLSDATAPAVLQPTGGTTGVPKIAVLTHAGLHSNVAQLHLWSGCLPGKETVLAVLPFFHVFGSTVVLLSAIAGGSRLVLHPNFCPRRVVKAFHKYRPGVVPMVPFMFTALCDELRNSSRKVDGLRICFSGAAPLNGEIKAEFEELTGAIVCQGYGLSEASPVTHANPTEGGCRTGTIGVPLPGTHARILDSTNPSVTLPPESVGELAIRGPQLMSGYLNNPEETDRVLRDGWLFTGDLASMTTDGFFKIVDRKKDMIITGGLNVYPQEVESVLRLHPAIAECAVVGMPDRRYGEKVTAFIVPTPGASIDTAKIQVFCRSQLAGYKIPRTIEVRDELPRNFLGKIRRIDLRDAA